MAGVVPKFVSGPITAKVAETIKGGQLVEARAGGLVGVAAAASVKVLGVATKDARLPVSGETTDAFGNVTLDVSQITEYVSIGVEGVYPVTYSANASFGDLLVATANGQVAPLAAAGAAYVQAEANATRGIVGRCWEPNGVVIATNAVGLAKING